MIVDLKPLLGYHLLVTLKRRSDFAAFYQVILENTYKFLLDNIKKCDIVIDAGANIGMFSILASRISGECGKVIAIEPEKSNLDILKENIELNSIKNIEIIPKALYNMSDKTLYLAGEGVGAHISTYGIPVKTVTLDDIVSEYYISPKILKMDIEGAEDKALEAGEKTLSTVKHMEMEVHGASQHEVVRMILNGEGFIERELPLENLSEIVKTSVRHPLFILKIEKNNKFQTSLRIMRSKLVDIIKPHANSKPHIRSNYPKILYYRK